MAARCGSLTEGPEIVDLRRLSGRELDPLLLEETAEWKQVLHWDFAKSAELVRQFTDTRALTGAALLHRGEVIGYGYSVVEDQKGLIGDLYVRPEWRDRESVLQLFRSLLDGLTGLRSLRRVESQLMLVDPLVGAELRESRSLEIYERLLLSFDFACTVVPNTAGRRRFHLEPWGDHLQESVAKVIALAYRDHVDSRINDQYGTVGAPLRFEHCAVSGVRGLFQTWFVCGVRSGDGAAGGDSAGQLCGAGCGTHYAALRDAGCTAVGAWL